MQKANTILCPDSQPSLYCDDQNISSEDEIIDDLESPTAPPTTPIMLKRKANGPPPTPKKSRSRVQTATKSRPKAHRTFRGIQMKVLMEEDQVKDMRLHHANAELLAEGTDICIDLIKWLEHVRNTMSLVSEAEETSPQHDFRLEFNKTFAAFVPVQQSFSTSLCKLHEKRGEYRAIAKATADLLAGQK